MSNLAIDININAPELVGAIEHLCVALGKPVSLVASTAAKHEPAPQPVQTAPLTPAPAQPVAAPIAPVQQPGTGTARSTAGSGTGRTGSSADRQDLHHGRDRQGRR